MLFCVVIFYFLYMNLFVIINYIVLGEFICPYTGTIMPYTLYRKLVKDKIIPVSDRLVSINLLETLNPASVSNHYQTHKEYVIVGHTTSAATYANGARNCNAKRKDISGVRYLLQLSYDETHSLPFTYMSLYAKKNIKKNEEITWQYKWEGLGEVSDNEEEVFDDDDDENDDNDYNY